MDHVTHCDAIDFASNFPDSSIHLLLTDPPYFKRVKSGWDHQWDWLESYTLWFCRVLAAYIPKLTNDASVVFFGEVGEHGQRPLFEIMRRLEGGETSDPFIPLFARNLSTWAKVRAYGKQFDYLFCREEIAWYSRSDPRKPDERKQIRFNVPYLQQLRGYAGWDKKYPAKDARKRCTNVMTDVPYGELEIPDETQNYDVITQINEVMRPRRECEKPLRLMQRLVQTHSHPGDLIVDPFCGTGTTGHAALLHGRAFRGCDTDPTVIRPANARLHAVDAM